MRSEKVNEFFEGTQFLNPQNAIFIAQIYSKYLKSKDSVAREWCDFFDAISDGDRRSFEVDFFGPKWQKRDVSVVDIINEKVNGSEEKAITVENDPETIFIKYGHLEANLDPIFGHKSGSSEKLNEVLQSQSSLIAELKTLYCGTIGAEFDHILNEDELFWLKSEYRNTIYSSFTKEQKASIAKDLFKAQSFEEFLHKKFTGMKRFSIQGGESSLVMLENCVKTAAILDYNEVLIGMAHRGRLNILANIAKKPIDMIFAEFAKNTTLDDSVADASWDVKYHAGYRSERDFDGKKINVQVAYNPSHLEAVNPVVMGMAYAKMKQGLKALPILIHGDAAFAGQGVVSECLNMSGIENYNSGGVLHLVVNNQIGFTAEPYQSRGSRYCTDIAKMAECPIFHVNGNDPEACVKLIELGLKYREVFKKDFVIDVICSRKYGHNEGDEPLYTNPVLYNELKNKKTTLEHYLDINDFSSQGFEAFKTDYLVLLDSSYDIAKSKKLKIARDESNKSNYSDKFVFSNIATGLSNAKDAKEMIEKIYTMPNDFNPNSRLAKQIEQKVKEAADSDIFDWSCGEILAFASLMKDGHSVRLTGQDSERGTFSHRHSIISDSINGKKYSILSNFESDKTRYEVCNSPLSEYAVLGFEHGFSLVKQDDLTIWEAQFGDFANGANTVFDQFIGSCEKKWLQLSNLVMLLPHGFEGQGPEHSSARLERYLQACAQENIIVANITTPANFFHILRRQVFANYRKPLVVMSPKSLLRNPAAVSRAEDFEKSKYFMPIIDDTRNLDKNKVKNVVITSGKVYYELLEKAEKDGIIDTAIIRIEQYYPFDNWLLDAKLAQYKNIESIRWVQEEPKNMGAWSFIRDYLDESASKITKVGKVEYVGRSASASPATGFEYVHKKEQEEVINKAFGGKSNLGSQTLL